MGCCSIRPTRQIEIPARIGGDYKLIDMMRIITLQKKIAQAPKLEITKSELYERRIKKEKFDFFDKENIFNNTEMSEKSQGNIPVLMILS